MPAVHIHSWELPNPDLSVVATEVKGLAQGHHQEIHDGRHKTLIYRNGSLSGKL